MEDRFKTIEVLKYSLQANYVEWVEAGYDLEDTMGLKQALIDNHLFGLETLVAMCINYGRTISATTIITEN
ncbi:MAG: hypothetical protein WCP46_00310 [Alphaproteobacteria bacterium]